jgi:hypothetical protein
MRIVVLCDAGPLSLLAMAVSARATLARLDRDYPGRLSLGKVAAPGHGARRVSGMTDQRALAGEVEVALKKGPSSCCWSRRPARRWPP